MILMVRFVGGVRLISCVWFSWIFIANSTALWPGLAGAVPTLGTYPKTEGNRRLAPSVHGFRIGFRAIEDSYGIAKLGR
jgi:hypothetical protein